MTDDELQEMLDELPNSGLVEKSDLQKAASDNYEPLSDDEMLAALRDDLGDVPDELKGKNAWLETAVSGSGGKGDFTAGAGGTMAITTAADMARSHAAMMAGGKRAREEREKRKREIRYLAATQNLLDLSDEIPTENVKLLIELLTAKTRDRRDKYSKLANDYITKMFRAAIPDVLLRCYDKFRSSCVKSVGFSYTTLEGIKFWLTPDVPYYIVQGEEQAIIDLASDKDVAAMEKAIRDYRNADMELDQKTYSVAKSFVGKTKRTYDFLLELNPAWFETLYNYLNERKKYNDSGN